MTATPAHFHFASAPQVNPAAVVFGASARFSLLTSRLIRMECAPGAASNGDSFEDRPSQVFWHRQQPAPAFQVSRTGDVLQIETSHLRLRYDERNGPAFTPASLSIELLETGAVWRYGDPDTGNLLGTTRTLDQVSGQTHLEPGLLSRQGWVVWDDMGSLVFNEEGWLEQRAESGAAQDLYFFGYGSDYSGCLQDFCLVAGRTPLLPRWALGNWWSRYWEYSQDELAALMAEFRRRHIPLSVCIVDMDWHITNTGNDCSGWTGYTWNRALFPDPPGFIRGLHELGLRTALNLHPAEGVHDHEAQYEAMCAAMGLDPSLRRPIPFDLADPRFALPYFSLLHHPLEAEGVDFWWLDWQQGVSSSLPGLDPLWWLNHLHFLDLGRDGQTRPFIFSRWGGLGNHRYPIGFSGDTHVNWESLAFQPYFTATAANVGYGWWSHDIGGHMFGVEEAELYTRWVQYGVFSPILRLHSTKNPFHERRPWGFDAETLRLTKAAMQLRHRLIPYLYTLSRLNHTAGTPPIRPMYHDYPVEEAAYSCPDQYTFGPALFAAPFTSRRDPETGLSRQVIWFPPGKWCDFFTGQPMEGARWQAVYGALEDTPVYARAGAIVPLDARRGWADCENPAALELLIFPGADGAFTLYEDDGVSTDYQAGAFAETPFAQEWDETGACTFTIGPAQGNRTLLPASRSYTLVFRGIRPPGELTVTVNGVPQSVARAFDAGCNSLILEAMSLTPADALRVELREVAPAVGDGRTATCTKLLRHFRLETGTKASITEQLPAILANSALLANYAIPLRKAQMRALLETITEAGVTILKHAGPEQRVILWNNHLDAGITFQLNAFTERSWHTRRVYRPEVGTVPATHILRVADLERYKHWRLSLRYGQTLAVTLSSDD